MNIKINDDKLPKIFFIMSLVIGIIFSILFPLYQVPDELVHINMMYSELGMDVDFYEETNHFGDTARIISNYDEKVKFSNYFDFDKKLVISDNYSIPKITIIRHFPQAIGMIISESLSLPIVVSITVGEICAVLFYAVMGSLTLKRMPIKKEVMMMIMLLPICIQQMASFSYDVVLLPICFYFIAYILYLKFSKDIISFKDLLIILVLLSIISIIKIPYVLLGLLIFIVPLKKISIYNLIIKNKKKIIVIGALILVLLIPALVVILNKISYGRILLAAIIYIKDSLWLILRTLWRYKFGYLKELTGDFGWFDTLTAIWYTIFIFLSILFISVINYDKDENIVSSPFTKKDVIYIYSIGIVMVMIIMLSMLEWTLHINNLGSIGGISIKEFKDIFINIPLIEGIQGRYFIPIIPLFLIPIYNKKITIKLKRFNITIFLVIYYLVLVIYMMIVILYRYWL